MAIVAGLFMKIIDRLFGRWRSALVAVLGIAVYTCCAPTRMAGSS
jgi:hypothetical protein